MPLTPGYGETPLPHDELDALLPEIVEILDKPITRADVYDVEQGVQDQVVEELMPAALDGSLPLDDLLSDHFVRDLHTRLFRPIWEWAGRQRQLEGNIGVAPEQIAVELRNTLGTIAWRWEHTATGRHGSWGSSSTPRQSAFIRSWTETGAPHGFSPTSYSPPLRIPPSSNTIGISTSRVTSRCCAPSINIGT